VDMVDQTE